VCVGKVDTTFIMYVRADQRNQGDGDKHNIATHTHAQRLISDTENYMFTADLCREQFCSVLLTTDTVELCTNEQPYEHTMQR
jgi:hypothetical protein